MSRIYEALKRAGPGQASTYADFTAPASELEPTAEIKSEDAPVATLPLIEVSKTIAEPHLHLCFQDLQARCVEHWQPNRQANVFSSGMSAKAAEQLRTLRSRLYQIGAKQQLKTLLITSAVPGEGKTFVATNLAHAIARQPERRVLLIDADLRKSQMHALLGANNSPGLTEYLEGSVDEMAVIQYSPENNLCFVAGGTTVNNPSELLSNGRLAKLLDRIAPVFEWIILDSPPSLPVADANVLAEHCDGLLFVARARVTPAAVIQKGCQELQGRKVIGMVLNAVDEDVLAYGAYSSAHGYEYVRESDH